MVSQQSLLQVLADGQWHSGEKLGEIFTVSRAAIWKQLQQLQTAGILLETERGKGYRLRSAMQLLDSKAVKDRLSPQAASLLTHLQLEFCLDSTNSRAMQLVEQGPDVHSVESESKAPITGHAIFAEQQTAGRGRRGRVWASPLGRNIYCSLIWRFSAGASALSGLSLAVGVATVKALEAQGYSDIQLKWPNDLLWRGRKLGGILLEMSGDAAGPCYVVIGLGINLTMSEMLSNHSSSDSADKSAESAANISQSIDQPWVDLLELGDNAPVNKNAIAAAILNQLLPMLVEFEKHGFSALVPEWQQRDAFVGRDIQLQLGAETIIGNYAGIQADGSITIETAAGKQSFNGGEISLRAIDNQFTGDL